MSMDRRQFVKLTGAGASGALATGAAGGQQTGVPTAEAFEFVGVSEDLRLVINSDSPTEAAEGISLTDVTPPLDIEGTADGGTWTSSPTTVTEQELIDAFRDFNEQTDTDLGTIVEGFLDTTPEDLVATLLEDLSVETLLANSDGAELFRIIADIIDALDLDAGQGEDIINAIEEGSAIIPDVPLITVPSIVEILEQDPALDVFIAEIAGFGIGDGNADKLLAGDVDRQTRANLLQTVIERVDDVIDSLPDLITDALNINIPNIPTLNDATDLVAFGDWALKTITEIQNSGLLSGQAINTQALEDLEAKVGENPDEAAVLGALAELDSQQTTGADTQQDTVSTQQQQQDPSLIDRLLEANSVAELDTKINTIASEIRNQGFDAVFGSGDGSQQDQDTLKILLDLLEQQLTLDVNIGEISGEFDTDNDLMTAPVGQSNVSLDGSFENGIISFVQDLLDQLDTGSDDGSNNQGSFLDPIIEDIDSSDLQGLIDELTSDLEAQNLIDLPPLAVGLTTGTSGSFDGAFEIEDGPAGGRVEFVANEFTVGYDTLISQVDAIDVTAALTNVDITNFDLKQDVIDNISDSAWDQSATKLGETLKGFAQDGGGFQNNPVAFLENNISGVSDFSEFLDETAGNAGQNIAPVELLADVTAALDVDLLVGVVTGVAPQAFTDSSGRHAVETDVTIVGVPASLTGTLAPQDLDGDGLFEDIRGTASSVEDIGVLDTQALFAALKDGTAQQTPRAFNFSQSGPDDEVTILDVAAHWRTHAAGE
jgi:hypothetical protein